MIDPVRERAAPTSPQLAMRIGVLGVLAFALFAIIFFRLWYMQVLSGDQYVAQAVQNRVRVLPKSAPRGDIVDRRGTQFVQNRQAIVLTLDPRDLPESERLAAATWVEQVNARLARPKGRRGPKVAIPVVPGELRDLFGRLAAVTGLRVGEIQERTIVGLAQLPYAPVRIKTDVSESLRNYVIERRKEFPGVDVDQRYVRDYRRGGLGAQLLGTVSEINPDQVGEKRYRGVRQGGLVGQSGLERSYDRFLRGQDGQRRFSVDAQGRQQGTVTDRPPSPGRQVRLSLDLRLQEAAQRALVRAGGGKPGAAVALDPEDGRILALVSYPTFDPNVLSKPITQGRYDAIFGEDAGSPQFNRAVTASYPAASTFKPITAMAGLATGLVDPSTTISDAGCVQLSEGPGGKRCNAGDKPNGSVDLVKSLRVSSDIYYYLLGQRLYRREGRALQEWAGKLGLGKSTGIDLPGEFGGTVPDRRWREERNKLERDCRKREKKPSCGITADFREYSEGDNVSLSTGQGDLQATPLQMAVAYAAIANGGRIVRPQLAERIEDDQGRLIQELSRPAARKVELPGLDAIREGLRQAVQSPGGTAVDVFAGWNHGRWPVFGKTGTAEVFGKGDQSWFICYVPGSATKKPIAIAVTVEGGGFGAETAAPVARQILSQWFTGKAGKFVAGKAVDR